MKEVNLKSPHDKKTVERIRKAGGRHVYKPESGVFGAPCKTCGLKYANDVHTASDSTTTCKHGVSPHTECDFCNDNTLTQDGWGAVTRLPQVPPTRTVLITENFNGNIHTTCQLLNLQNRADEVFSIHPFGSEVTVVIFKVKVPA